MLKLRSHHSLLVLLVQTFSLFAQSNSGELRLQITDPHGLGVRSSVELVSEANQFRKTLVTDEAGNLAAKLLPFGIYRIEVRREGFAPYSRRIEIRTAVPATYRVTLNIAPLSTSVTVNAPETLIDPHRPGTVQRIGQEEIANRPASLPGRSVQDLVNSQPGWLYEGTVVLHPRGSEYQTQLVVDGIPLTDNRSPSRGPEIEADDVQAMSVYTAGIPAEFGRKMGGVVEIVTSKDSSPGLHGEAVLGGGSFDTADGYVLAEYGWKKNALAVSVDGARTNRYLDPPVLQNFSNTGTTGDFSIRYERELTDHDRLSLSVRHALSRFLVPNEQIQQAAGQRQDRNNFETMGIASWQHVFSENVMGDFRGMVRDDSEGLSSNPQSTPILAFQDNGFREGYFKGTISIHRGRNEWKAGVEADSTFLREKFSDSITDFTRFDPGTPPSYSFASQRPDLEQSAFVQDLIRLGAWTVSAGLRWDHYQLLVNEHGLSPRLGISRYFPSADLVVHASYDRVFQTPDFENILLSSSNQVVSLNPEVLRLPVLPSHGNYFEFGVTKGFFQQLKLDLNYFDRAVNNFADDDQLLDTAVSFPIAFRKAHVYGAEGKLEIPRWGRFSGFVSHSYMVGSAFLPVTGGLFLGDDATHALTQTNGRFWVTQDQRHTSRARVQVQLTNRVWFAGGWSYGTGLPVEFTGIKQQAVAQFGQSIVDRVDFARGRVKPSFSLDASAGADLWHKDRWKIRLQADLQNINNRLNLIDFAGLFSGNVIAASRSYALRLTTNF
jgi:outer membrane cobalamin receptor